MLERIIDVAADELGIDPAELRRTQLHPARRVPAHHGHRRQLRRGRVREGARRGPRGLAATTSCGPSRHGAGAAGDPKLLGIGVVDLRRGHGRRSGCQGVRRGRRSTTTARVTVTRRHVGARPGPRHRVLDDRRRPPRHPDGPGRASSSPTPRGPPGDGTMGSRSLQIGGSACRRRRRGRAGEGQHARRPPARGQRRRHRRAATAVCVAGVPAEALSWAELARRGQRPGHVGRGRRARARPRAATSTRATRPTRSAPTWRSSRSTPRPGGVRAPAPRRRRRLRPHPQPAARRRPAARRHRPGHGPGPVRGGRYDDDGNPLTGDAHGLR